MFKSFLIVACVLLVSGCMANTVCVPRGCNIFPVDAITDEKILPDDNLTINASNHYNIAAAPGEYEPFSFVIRPTRDMRMSLEATDLIGPGAIPSSQVNIRVVKTWWQAGAKVDDNKHPLLVPELLIKDASLIKVEGNYNFLKLSNGTYINISGGPGSLPLAPASEQMDVRDSDKLLPVDFSKDTNTQFLVTVNVPINTTGGNYTGEILVKNTTTGIVQKNIYINLTIHDFELSDPIIDYGIYYQTVIGATGKIDSRYRNASQAEAELADLKAHGIEYPGLQYQNGNDVQMLNMRRDAGLDNKSLFYFGTMFQDYGNDRQALINVINILKNRFAPYGFESIYMYGPDEADLNNSLNRAQMETVHSQGWKVFDSQNDPDIAYSVADILDLPIVFGPLNKSLAFEYHDYCNDIANYGNPQGSTEVPGTQRLNYGLRLWQNDYDVGFPFAYQWRYGNAWGDFDDAHNRDHSFVYPTSDGVIDTLQWEGFREGVDDIRYLSTLLEVLECSEENTTEAENWLADLKTHELTQEDLPFIRSQMVEYIVALRGAYT